jgi:hypothetical protein
MGFNQAMLDKLLPQWVEHAGKSEEAARSRYVSGAQSGNQQIQDNDAKLAQLIRGKQIDEDNRQGAIDANMSRARDEATRLGLKPGKFSVNVSEGSMALNPEPPPGLSSLIMPLTPAQQKAEENAGKSIHNYELMGGRSTFEKNENQINSVLGDIEGDKRDDYDQKVGGMLQSHPALMGILAPSEKGRRDKVRNAYITMVKQVDPNTSEKQANDIFSQVYDPASDNATNLDRLRVNLTELKAKRDALEQGSQNYHRTGYVTIGGRGTPTPRQAGPAHVRVRNAQTGAIEILQNPTPQDLEEAAAEGYEVVR